MPSGSLGLSLLIVAPVLIITGAISIWLGTNGTVINNAIVHFGATTTAEINAGIIFLSIGIAALVIFLALLFVKKDALKVHVPHFPS